MQEQQEMQDGEKRLIWSEGISRPIPWTQKEQKDIAKDERSTNLAQFADRRPPK